jgi:hypothetical protein
MAKRDRRYAEKNILRIREMIEADTLAVVSHRGR